MIASKPLVAWVCAAVLGIGFFGCDKKDGNANGGKGNTIVVDGSDTMVNLSQAWAEAYMKSHPGVDIQVSGGGSGVGINSLIAGKVDLANASRKMDPKEIEKFKAAHGGTEPKEHILGLDALAIYISKSNTLESISLEELAEIFGDNGTIDKWSQVGVSLPGDKDTIVRVGRQNSSGTYAYFREHVLGKGRNYKKGTLEQSGSKDVVALVANTPNAIGYSGMGYKTDNVKWLKISKKKGETGIAPSPDAARAGTYPISRPLFIYTPGEPQGATKDFIEWCKGPEGQKILSDVGYVTMK